MYGQMELSTEFKMVSFIGPCAKIIKVVFLSFPPSLMEMHFCRQRRVFKWEQRASSLKIDDEISRYDIILYRIRDFNSC